MIRDVASLTSGTGLAFTLVNACIRFGSKSVALNTGHTEFFIAHNGKMPDKAQKVNIFISLIIKNLHKPAPGFRKSLGGRGFSWRVQKQALFSSPCP